MATKICSKCKRELDISCFYKNKSKPGGITTQCKFCCKRYQKDNKERVTEYNRNRYKNNKVHLLEQQKQYYKDNAKLILKRQKQYYENNTGLVLQRHKGHCGNYALFETYSKQLEIFEEIRRCIENSELLEVKCAYCGRWLTPTNLQVKNRLQSFKGQTGGECRFYCSENCKQACPTYGQMKYPKGFKQATSREVVPLLRQLVLKRDNYTCQMCGATIETAELHVHHIISYMLNKMLANDPDSCITLCKECHKLIHRQMGCRYSDLKCGN